MSSVQNLRELINQRLTAAAEEIFTEFEKTIVQYEEEIDRQRRLLDNIWKPQITQHTADLPQQHVWKEEDILAEQKVCNQQRDSSVDQEDLEIPQMKEEQDELCTSVFLKDPESLQIGKEEQEKLCTSMDQGVPEPPKIKQDQDELCTNQEGRQLVLKQETNTFVVNPAYEESDYSKPERSRNQLLSHNSPVSVKRKRRNSSHSNNIDNPPVSESQCDTDTGKKSVKCGICGKSFKYMSHLKKHYFSHTSEKPYTCETCGTCFNRSGSLKRHMITHTGEKPYPCRICGKSFTLNRSLKIHMQLHTGEKPYSCETCGKSFIYSSYLKVHMTCHTGEKPYSCTLCEKRFCYPTALKKHLRIHTGERP
ncbi:zinc finger protein 287-like [Amphiprion ocellaris]|uniref:zinc finger protein 287-like n=1 Tax=Amphiprion ocellaris TaxID=80972 RepID=UPI0024115E41|nr:zinc finger protein 287-like [Amphiprion ocellaris]